jgi:zinc protease
MPRRPDAIVFDSLKWQVPLGAPYRRVLANGLRVYIAPDNVLPMVTLIGQVHYGSIADPAGKEGLGALLCQLMRSGGTTRLPADSLDMLLDLLAVNVSFSLSESRLQFTCSFLSEFTDTALGLLKQMLFSPAFEPGRIEKERDDLLESVRHRFDNPGPVLSAAFQKAMYAGTAAGRLTTERSLKSISREDIVRLHKSVFTTGNIILGVSGKFATDSLVRRLERLFPAAQPRDSSAITLPSVSFGRPYRGLVVHKPMTQAYVRLALPMFKRPHPDYYACNVLNEILGGGGFLSRLNASVRSDAGLTYSIYSEVESNYTYPGTFYVHFYTKTESTVEAIKLVLAELERIRSEGVTPAELTATKNMLIQSLPSMFRDADDLVERYSWNEYYGRSPDHFRAYPDSLRAVSADQVLAMARKYLVPESLTCIVVGDTTALYAVDTSRSFSIRGLKPLRVVPADSLPGLP